MALDTRTIERLLTPFERNCLFLVRRHGRDSVKIAQNLRGGNETMDGFRAADGLPIVRVVGRDTSVTPARVEEALAEAGRKIAAHMERTGERIERPATNGDGEEGTRVAADEAADELRKDDPVEQLRDGMPPMRSSDPMAETQRQKSGSAAVVRRRSKPGKRQRAMLAYLEEHGPSLQADVTRGLGSSAASEALRRLEQRGLVVRGGKGHAKTVALAGQDPNLAEPDGVAAPPAGAEAGAREEEGQPPRPDGAPAQPAPVNVGLQVFLYLLMREELPTGRVRRLIDEAAGAAARSPKFTSDELAALAERYGRELLG